MASSATSAALRATRAGSVMRNAVCAPSSCSSSLKVLSKRNSIYGQNRKNLEPLDPRQFEKFMEEYDPSQAPSIRLAGGGAEKFEVPGMTNKHAANNVQPWDNAEIRPEKPPPGYCYVEGVFDNAFQIDGEKYRHSLLLLPQLVLQWHPRKPEDITPESFAPVCAHYPAIRHIFVGVGYTVPFPTKLEWTEYLSQYHVTCETVTVANAMRLFNMQNTLFQNFACALVYEVDVMKRLYSITRKIDLGMEDPVDPDAHKRDLLNTPL